MATPERREDLPPIRRVRATAPPMGAADLSPPSSSTCGEGHVEGTTATRPPKNASLPSREDVAPAIARPLVGASAAVRPPGISAMMPRLILAQPAPPPPPRYNLAFARRSCAPRAAPPSRARSLVRQRRRQVEGATRRRRRSSRHRRSVSSHRRRVSSCEAPQRTRGSRGASSSERPRRCRVEDPSCRKRGRSRSRRRERRLRGAPRRRGLVGPRAAASAVASVSRSPLPRARRRRRSQGLGAQRRFSAVPRERQRPE